MKLMTQNRGNYRNILIYHLGNLGDTLVALPGFQAVRSAFPKAHIVLLTYDDDHFGPGRIHNREILGCSGLVDEYLCYKINTTKIGKVFMLPRMTVLLTKLRRRKFDALIYLLPIDAGDKRAERDRFFFRAAGIRDIIGLSGFMSSRERVLSHPLPTVPHISDQLLSRLAASGLTVSSVTKEKRFLHISAAEQDAAAAILRRQGGDGGRRWVAIAPGSKMPAKIWPKERYREVVQRLIDFCDVWPVVFGGPEDEALGRELTFCWKRGYVAAGSLNIRESTAAIAQCGLCIGNDTGTLHMAAFSGVRCVGVYSARDYPGLWYPYGEGHFVFRRAFPCEGCMKEACIDRDMACIRSIGVDEVFNASLYILNCSKQHSGAVLEHGSKP